MSTQYIKYLPKFKSSIEFTEEFKKSEAFKKAEELQPYISVDPNKFPITDKIQPKKKNERKLNIRVKQHDIYLLDAIAKQDEMSRSALINKILYIHFLGELMKIEDKDARALLAGVADKNVYYDNLARPWVHDALEAEFSYVFDNFMKYNSRDQQQPQQHPEEPPFNSDLFIGLVKKLKGLKK